MRFPAPDQRAFLDQMPGSDIPVIRQPFVAGDLLPYWSIGIRPGDHVLFNHSEDPAEERNLTGTGQEKRAIDLLRAALEEVDAPEDQFVRLGIR